ncbi:MAG: hypothetical protein LH468_09180 [Nocardioides sp.]|nr:hypothetical protein [Nocardioides sp.]
MSAPSPETRLVVLVTGSMRSGTSSLAGSLSLLGLHVPQPEVPAAPRNPKGHFESRWVIEFHKRHLLAARVRPSDSSPQAQQRVDAVLADGWVADELAAWLAEQHEPRIVVKDPHAHWFLATWQQVAGRTGRDLRLVTPLRHPAEVVGSQERTWGHRRDDAMRLMKETSNVAGWLNVVLVTERGGRGAPRAFSRYTDLLDDWRATLGRVCDQLDLDLPVPGVGVTHVLDEFLDTGLRTSRLSFDDIRVPARLQTLAAEAWTALETLVTAPDDAPALAVLDRVRADYDDLYAESRAIALDDRHHAARVASQEKAARMRVRTRRLRARLEQRDAEIERLTRPVPETPAARARRLAGRVVRRVMR